MSVKEKVPFADPVLDIEGDTIRVGSRLAYAVRRGNHAELRVGVVKFIESKKDYWHVAPRPILYMLFEGNDRMARCENPKNAKVLGLQ